MVQKALSKEELLKLSRIVLIDEGNPALEAFNRAVRVEHLITTIKDSIFFGLEIKHAYVITSQRRKANASDSDK